MKQNTDAATDAEIETIADDAHILSVPAETNYSDWQIKAARKDNRSRPAHHKNEYVCEVIRDWGDMKTVAVWTTGD
jgi:hypothetical protein